MEWSVFVILVMMTTIFFILANSFVGQDEGLKESTFLC
jgi:hypothetical protein